MSKQSNQSTDGGKEKMVVTSFRLPESTLAQVKRKLGPLAIPGKFFRVLVSMWLDGRITVTDEDIKKYSE